MTKKALKKKPGKKKIEKEKVEAGPKRIRGYDYRSWDKFDVVNYFKLKKFIHEYM